MAGERTLPGLGLTGFWDLGSPYKDQMDENLRRASLHLQPSITESRATEPGSPTNGTIYRATGAWGGATTGQIVVRDNGAWVAYTPQEGWEFWDRAADAKIRFDGTAWVTIAEGGGGASSFLGLSDTPANYTGKAGKFVRVNAGASALEFTDPPEGGGGGGGQAMGVASWTPPGNIFTTQGTVDATTINALQSDDTWLIRTTGARDAWAHVAVTPGADFDVVFLLAGAMENDTFLSYGVFVEDGGNGRKTEFHFRYNDAFHQITYNGTTYVADSSAFSPNASLRPYGPTYWRIERVGSNLHFSLSSTGIDWLRVWTVAVTNNSQTDITRVGFSLHTPSLDAGNALWVRCLGYSATGPEPELVLGAGGEGGGGGEGATTFLGLTDTPSAYTGAGGKIVAVKSDGTGLEFIDPPEPGEGGGGGGGASALDDLDDVIFDHDEVSPSMIGRPLGIIQTFPSIQVGILSELQAIPVRGGYDILAAHDFSATPLTDLAIAGTDAYDEIIAIGVNLVCAAQIHFQPLPDGINADLTNIERSRITSTSATAVSITAVQDGSGLFTLSGSATAGNGVSFTARFNGFRSGMPITMNRHAGIKALSSVAYLEIEHAVQPVLTDVLAARITAMASITAGQVYVIGIRQSAQPLVAPFDYEGSPSGAATLARFVVPIGARLRNGAQGRFHVGTSPAALTTLEVRRNGTPVGTITIPATSGDPVVSIPTTEDLDAGDVLTLNATGASTFVDVFGSLILEGRE